MATTIESKGIDRSVAEPTDVSSLRTRDIGHITKGYLSNFVNDHQQPPLSRYFATVDLESIKDGPDIRQVEYEPKLNPSFQRAIEIEIGSSARKFNSLDAQVIKEIIEISRVLVMVEIDKMMEIFSKHDKQFAMTWEGERNNVV